MFLVIVIRRLALPALPAFICNLPLRLLCLLDVLKSCANMKSETKHKTKRRYQTYSMPRSTSGIAVSIARLLVTLPSSAARFSIFHRSESAIFWSCVLSPSLACNPPGWSSGGRLRTLRFSSIYAILQNQSLKQRTHRRWERPHICLFTSTAFVCCVKLFVRTARRALACASPSSLCTHECVEAGQRH